MRGQTGHEGGSIRGRAAPPRLDPEQDLRRPSGADVAGDEEGDDAGHAYVRLAFDEIRLAGAGSPQVSRRLMAALTDLRSMVPDERSEIIDEQIRLLEAAIEAAFDERAEVAFGLVEDREGIGVAAGAARR